MNSGLLTMCSTQQSDIPHHQCNVLNEVGANASLVVQSPDDLYYDLHEARAQLGSLLSNNLRTRMKSSTATWRLYLWMITQFTALSHVWGNPKITEKIVVNGVDQAVTTNLATVLRQLRTGARISHGRESAHVPLCVLARLLWVDAICIKSKKI